MLASPAFGFVAYGKMRFFVLIMCFVGAAAHADFERLQQGRAVPGNTDLTETVWRAPVPPYGEYDQIGLHRIALADSKPVALVLYLPGTNMNGEISVTDEAHNLWLYLARRGVAVYTLDYRTHFVPNEPVPDDTAFMGDWTMERFVEDAALAAAFIREREALPLFAVGFSRGVGYAYALAGQVDLDGLVALDGSFKSYAPTGFDREGAMAKLAAGGGWASVLSRSRGWAGRTELMTRAADNPDGPAIGNFDSIGAQLTETLYYAWGKGGLANPVDGISRISILARAMIGYDRVFPAIQNIEGRSIASHADDPSTSLDDHFGSMTLPIIYFGATNLGADSLMSGIYSASKSGSDDVTLHVLENYGHIDVLVGEEVAREVFHPTLQWMLDRIDAEGR